MKQPDLPYRSHHKSEIWALGTSGSGGKSGRERCERLVVKPQPPDPPSGGHGLGVQGWNGMIKWNLYTSPIWLSGHWQPGPCPPLWGSWPALRKGLMPRIDDSHLKQSPHGQALSLYTKLPWLLVAPLTKSVDNRGSLESRRKSDIKQIQKSSYDKEEIQKDSLEQKTLKTTIINILERGRFLGPSLKSQPSYFLFCGPSLFIVLGWHNANPH